MWSRLGNFLRFRKKLLRAALPPLLLGALGAALLLIFPQAAHASEGRANHTIAVQIPPAG